tara:strand:- start:199 stop:411 length:213 start_codon:yes stop_codon:yes gene_type:complete
MTRGVNKMNVNNFKDLPIATKNLIFHVINATPRQDDVSDGDLPQFHNNIINVFIIIVMFFVFLGAFLVIK